MQASQAKLGGWDRTEETYFFLERQIKDGKCNLCIRNSNSGNRTEYIVRCASVTILPIENMLRKHNLTPGVLPDTLKQPKNITKICTVTIK